VVKTIERAAERSIFDEMSQMAPVVVDGFLSIARYSGVTSGGGVSLPSFRSLRNRMHARAALSVFLEALQHDIERGNEEDGETG
jgi:hypothetical protein